MSHIPQRKEKDCLNCGTVVQGRYCHVCGQENVVPKETFWHMVTHFFNDITHFDGSFFTTAKDLLFKPGFLSKEYMAGRRVKYLHPVRMYVFTSAIFFLLFFSFFTSTNVININTTGDMSGKDRVEKIAALEKKYKNDSTKKELLEKLQTYKDTLKGIAIDDLPLFVSDFNIINISGRANNYASVFEYDSLQKALPKKEKDGWFTKRLIQKEVAIRQKYSSNPGAAIKKLGNDFLHRLPYLLFVSLPLFALILRLLYVRRKQFYFADHAIFTIHFYVFTFILLLLVFTFDKLQDATGLGFFDYFIVGSFIIQIGYLYKAIRFFYEQRRVKTLVKLILIFIASLIMMIILFAFFLFFTAFSL